MLFEDIILLLLFGVGIFLIGIPTYKLVAAIVPKKRNPLKEAKERLELVRVEIEAAKLNKEAEKLAENLYSETLDDDDKKEKKL